MEAVWRGLGTHPPTPCSQRLAGATRGRAWATTTAAVTSEPTAHLLDRHFTATPPNQLCVADFTYVAPWRGFVYVAFVVDIDARRIVGWRVNLNDVVVSNRCGSGSSTTIIPAVPAAWSVTTLAFIAPSPSVPVVLPLFVLKQSFRRVTHSISIGRGV